MKLRKPPYFSLGSAMNLNVRRVRPVLFLTISILILYVLNTIRRLDEYDGFIIKRPNSYRTVKYLTGRSTREKVKMIHIWTDGFEDLNLVNGHLLECSSRCNATNNTNLLMDSDAVLFHLADIWIPNGERGTKRTIPFPNISNPNQVWIIHISDPPVCLLGDVNIFGKIFNWTMSYRSDSTIFNPYGRYMKVDDESDNVRKGYDKRNIYLEKVKFIVGTLRNRTDPVESYLLTNEMSKYIDIEMLGTCHSSRLCGTGWGNLNKDCDENFKKYRFYLAFESIECKDYITEYWMALHREQIPIVNWKRMDTLNGYVPNSYINVYDFSSVKALAEYITLVNRNESLYNSFFEWKKNFTIDLTGRSAWCDLCEKLHSMDKHYESQSVDLKEYIDSDVCPAATVSKLFKPVSKLSKQDKFPLR
ncbi:hypothetical protein ACJMK2_039323 [Sinanodonta woodiana]|uniref:Fucosyltransferase n=1 Tax=Sinanodonta woodiana TaxID=1069815 RepID=A0ABD3WD60_SINWO